MIICISIFARHYTTCCKKPQSCAPEDGQKFARNMLSWSLEINKTVIVASRWFLFCGTEYFILFEVHLIYTTFQEQYLVPSVNYCFYFSDIFAFVLLSIHAASHNKLSASLKAVNNIQIEMASFKMYFRKFPTSYSYNNRRFCKTCKYACIYVCTYVCIIYVCMYLCIPIYLRMYVCR